MKPLRDDELAAAMSSLRPTPSPAYVAELDQRAAAGFPRSRRERSSRLARLVARLRATPPRRLAAAASGAVLVTIAVATALAATNGGLTSNHLNMDVGNSATESGPVAPTKAKRSPQGALLNFDGSASNGATAAGETSAAIKPFSAETPTSLTTRRSVERAAEMTLGTEPSQVDDAAAKVFDAVHAYDGIVMRSSVGRDSGEARAEFDLLIPSAKLGDALAAFSRIAAVRSRHEATADITAPTVGAAEQLRDSRARTDSLLAQLGAAETESERDAVEAELRGERRHAAALRSQLLRLKRRADLSRVSLRIESGSGASPAGRGGGSWGIGDALHDAGHILSVAAAVTLVGLAVLAPFALIALIAWLSVAAWRRRARERALGLGNRM